VQPPDRDRHWGPGLCWLSAVAPGGAVEGEAMSSSYPQSPPPPPPPLTANNDNDNNDAINLGIGIGVETNSNEQTINPEQHDPHRQIEDAFQHQHPQEEHQPPISPHQPTHGLPLYDTGLDGHGISDAQTHIDAVAAAHHGLQALQAAVAAPAVSPGPAPSNSPETPQYGTHGESLYRDPLYHIDRNGLIPIAAPPSKVTRLRRACDMCSQRKVKVCQEQFPLVAIRSSVTDPFISGAVRRKTPMPAMSRPQCRMHLSPRDEASRSSQ